VPSLKVLSLFRELYACLGHGSRDDATSSKAPAAWRQEQNGLVRNVGRLFNPQPGSVFRNVDDQARAERQFVVGFASERHYVGGSPGQFCAAAPSLSEMVVPHGVSPPAPALTRQTPLAFAGGERPTISA